MTLALATSVAPRFAPRPSPVAAGWRGIAGLMMALPVAMLVAMLLLAAGPARALDRTLALNQFHHRAWTAADGVPMETWTMAQTPDGLLWMGGPNGLIDTGASVAGLRAKIAGLTPAESCGFFNYDGKALPW